MLALVLIDHALRHRGQNADVAHGAAVQMYRQGMRNRQRGRYIGAGCVSCPVWGAVDIVGVPSKAGAASLGHAGREMLWSPPHWRAGCSQSDLARVDTRRIADHFSVAGQSR